MSSAAYPFEYFFKHLGLLGVVCLSLVVFAASLAVAQDVRQKAAIDAWEQTAKRAEEALQAGEASTEAFESLRSELAEQRAQAQAMATAGRVAIRSLKAQIESLGPAPGKDQTEPEPVAQRRKQLTDTLAKAEEPAVAARQAYARSNVLIEEIDALVRGRSASDLFVHKPSPLLPSSWSHLPEELSRFYDRVSDDTLRAGPSVTGEGGATEPFGDRIVIALVLAVVAIILPLLGGHFLLLHLERRLAGRPGTVRFISKAVGLQVLRLMLSTLGGGMLMAAFILAEIGPTTMHNLSGVVLVTIGIFIITNWAGNILFAPNQPMMRLLDLDDALATTCYWLSLGFACALSVEALVDGLAEDFSFSAASLGVLQAISIAINLVVLLGLARVLRAVAAQQRQAAPDDAADDALAPGFFTTAARALQILAVGAFLAAILGFVALARAGLSPIMLSLTLFAVAYILHHAIMVPVSGAFRRQQSTASIISVVLGIGLILTCLPALALIWGARASDVTEAWRLIQNGVDIGGTRLSPKMLIVLTVTFLIGLFLTRWLQRVVDRVVLPRTRVDRGGRNAINTGLGYLGVILSALLAISAAGLDLSNLAIIAGALSVGVGFGLQAIVSNFVSGIILLIERPIKEGDWIEVSGFSGVVRKIAVRSTRIETFDRHDVIIPNADLISGTVKNRTLSSRVGRLSITLAVKPEVNVDELRPLLIHTAKSNPGILPTPEPQVFLTKLTSGSQELEIRCFLRDVGTEVATRSDLLFAFNASFRRAGMVSPLA